MREIEAKHLEFSVLDKDEQLRLFLLFENAGFFCILFDENPWEDLPEFREGPVPEYEELKQEIDVIDDFPFLERPFPNNNFFFFGFSYIRSS